MAEPFNVQCSSACTVTVQLEAPPANPEHLGDLSAAWGLFFGAAIIVVLLKKIYDIFDKAPHGDS